MNLANPFDSEAPYDQHHQQVREQEEEQQQQQQLQSQVEEEESDEDGITYHVVEFPQDQSSMLFMYMVKIGLIHD